MDIELAKDIAKRIRESSVREVAYGIDNDVVAKVLEDLIEENESFKWYNNELRRCANVQEVDRYAALNRMYAKEIDRLKIKIDEQHQK